MVIWPRHGMPWIFTVFISLCNNFFFIFLFQNSIRHNLSLHNRFVRVQNEGTGKSSWWMLNPDAKPGKSARRRATSMETSKFEKRRGRVKKKVEALRAAGEPTPSPSSSVSESLDLFPESPLHGFQLRYEFVSFHFPFAEKLLRSRYRSDRFSSRKWIRSIRFL